jgi:GNAT superfamily N-acetyltransferase
MQRRGIGRMLMDRLIEAALERGVDVFHSEFLAGNVPMRELLETLSPETRFVPQGPVVTAEFALRAPSESPSDATPDTTPRPDIYTWMRLVAEQAVQLRRRFEMLFDPH